MCNAANNLWNSRCGFGGDGPKGRSIGRGFSILITKMLAVPRIESGYTTLNWGCQNCGGTWESSSDGKVFFEEHGPLWSSFTNTLNG